MFNNDIFEDWLDTKAKEIVSDMGSGKSLSTEEMMVLVLKAQSNHFEHLLFAYLWLCMGYFFI